MDNTSTVRKCEQDLEAARMTLKKLQEGDEPMERRNAEVKFQNGPERCHATGAALRELKDWSRTVRHGG